MPIRPLRLALLLLPLACAGVEMGPVAADDAQREAHPRRPRDGEVSGVRFYQSAPFLLVHSDGKGGLRSEVLFLPDATRRMHARPYAILAENDTALHFENGVLTRQATTVDETAVPEAVVSALQTALESGALGLLNQVDREAALPGRPFPAPYLFRIVVEPEGVRLVGGPRMDPIAIPIPRLEKPKATP